jgi:hypothetical protein
MIGSAVTASSPSPRRYNNSSSYAVQLYLDREAVKGKTKTWRSMTKGGKKVSNVTSN